MSPAVTPLDTQFCLPEYTIPGEYFTPLTSPALEARNSNGNGYMHNTTHASDLAFLASPIDPFNNQVPTSSAPSSPGIVKKQRRKQSTASTRAATRAVRQSPSVRPQSRRKPHTGSSLNPEDGHPSSWDQNKNGVKTSGGSHNHSSNENSVQDSVSPEPLSEPLMPPPAVPRSGKSTFNNARESGSDSKSSEAATPATLMKLQKQHAHTENTGPQFSGASTVVVNDTPDQVMTDAAAPSNTNPSPGHIDTKSNEQTPTLVAKGISPNSAGPLAEKPLPSPVAPSPVAPSPQTGSSASPALAPKKGDSKSSGRVSKKRGSVNSSQASPALRPKISPSIQPLIRNDGKLRLFLNCIVHIC